MDREKEIVKTSIIGIIGNILLVIGKMIVGLIAKSVSIITDAVNNLSDVMSSTVTIIGTKISNKKPDRKHPYGHGRAEFLTSSVIGMLIFLAGVLAIYESTSSLISGEEPTYNVFSFIIISLAILVKIGLGLFFKKKGKKVDSGALSASGLDALLDSLLSFGTLIGAIVSYTTGVHLEGYIGIAIGLFILKSSIGVFKESISKILGERTDAEFIAKMSEDILADPEVYGVYDMIINNYGADRNIGSVHVEVEDDMTAKEIQVLERRLAYLCYEKYHTLMTVGIYARNENGEENMAVKEKVMSIVSKYPQIIQTHGFYFDDKKKMISLDIIISFEAENGNEIYEAVCAEIREAFPDMQVYVILDKDYSVS